MMRCVLDHSPGDITDRLSAHHRTRWQRFRELLRGMRPEKLNCVRIRLPHPLPRGGKRSNRIHFRRVSREIQIETLRPRCPLDKPLESLGCMRYLLRRGHHAVMRPEIGVWLLQNPGGALEEILAGKELID